jgi:hypothetical protein
MRKAVVANSVAVCLCLAAFGLTASPLPAADATKGTLVVGGKPAEITHAYAYTDKSFNEGKDVLVVVLSDAPIPSEAVQDDYARKQLVAAGKLNYVELMVGSEKQEIHFEVQHKRFGMMMQPSGDDSDHVLEVKTLDGKTIAGRARTTSPQKSFDDVPYSYDITFSAQIAPAKQN